MTPEVPRVPDQLVDTSLGTGRALIWALPILIVLVGTAGLVLSESEAGIRSVVTNLMDLKSDMAQEEAVTEGSIELRLDVALDRSVAAVKRVSGLASVFGIASIALGVAVVFYKRLLVVFRVLLFLFAFYCGIQVLGTIH